MVIGTIAGVAGGVIRDILSSEVPLILRSDIYTTAAICSSITYLILISSGFNDIFSVIFSLAIVLLLRSLSIIWGLRLPVFKLPGTPN